MEESWRNYGGTVIEEETWRRHLGSIWKLSRKHRWWFWESFGNHLGTQEAPRGTQATQEAPGAPGLKK